MDNMKPLIDAVSDDGREEAAMGDEAGRPHCRGARRRGQRGSSCNHNNRSRYPHWTGMMPHMGPSCEQLGGHPSGPRCGPPCGPSFGPPSGRHCGPSYGQPGGPPFMYDKYVLGPNQGPWSRGPLFMNGPHQCEYPWVSGMAPMNDFGPMFCPWNGEPSHMQGSPAFESMACPWNACPGWADKATDDRSDEERVGKEKTDDVGEDTEKQEEEAGNGKSGQQCPRCPWVNRMRRNRMRQGNCPMYRRCRRGFGAQSHCPPGDCCPMGWTECPYPPPFRGAGESNSDPENDNQKQDGSQPILESFYPFSQGPSGFEDRRRTCCYGNRQGWQCGPSRSHVYKMLSWKRNVLKERLQRIESHLERLRPNEDETKETTTGKDAGHEQASSMSAAPEGATPMDTHAGDDAGEPTGREWEVVVNSE